MPRLTRRRCVFAGGFAILCGAAVAAWWLSVSRLTDDERRIVGNWHYSKVPNGYGHSEWQFASDRTVTAQMVDPASLKPVGSHRIRGRWGERKGIIYVDWREENQSRVIQDIKDYFAGVSRPKWELITASTSDEELTFRQPDGTPYRMTKAPER